MRKSLVVFACVACLLGATGIAASGWRTAPAPARGLIVYWQMSPVTTIFVARLGTPHPRRILRNRQNAKRPRLSPDRKWVAFDGAPPGKGVLSDFDIQIVRLDGAGRRTLTKSDLWDVDAQWSPDGKLLSFTRIPHEGNPPTSEIWTVRRDGTDLKRIGLGSDARWSPDGTKLVFDASTSGSRADLFVMDTDGTNKRQLLATAKAEAPAGWSPDGKTILFTRFNDNTGRNGDVFVIKPDGTGVRKLAHGIAGAWSPNGSQIAYTAPFRLLIMNADGSHKRKTKLTGVWDPDWG